jgi:hypothetical protein
MAEIPDVPRNANGWPTIEPNFFTLDQLLLEAEKWRSCANNEARTVGKSHWHKYTDELINRGFMDEVDVRAWVHRGMPIIKKTDGHGEWVIEFPV